MCKRYKIKGAKEEEGEREGERERQEEMEEENKKYKVVRANKSSMRPPHEPLAADPVDSFHPKYREPRNNNRQIDKLDS